MPIKAFGTDHVASLTVCVSIALPRTVIFKQFKQFNRTIQQNSSNRFKQYEWTVVPARTQGINPSDKSNIFARIQFMQVRRSTNRQQQQSLKEEKTN